MKKVLATLIIYFLTVMNVYAQGVEISFFKTDNVDLAGYRFYMSDTPDGQVVGAESPNLIKTIPYDPNSPEIIKTIITMPGANETMTYYITATCFDICGRESAKAKEVKVTFPVPQPTTLEITGFTCE